MERPDAVWHRGAETVQNSIGDDKRLSEPLSPPQAQLSPPPWRLPHSLVMFCPSLPSNSCATTRSFACQLDRLADFALGRGDVTFAEYLSGRAADLRAGGAA
jgi:hypothetical protein